MAYLTVNKQGYNYLNNQYTCTLYFSSTKTIKNQYIYIDMKVKNINSSVTVA